MASEGKMRKRSKDIVVDNLEAEYVPHLRMVAKRSGWHHMRTSPTFGERLSNSLMTTRGKQKIIYPRRKL